MKLLESLDSKQVIFHGKSLAWSETLQHSYEVMAAIASKGLVDKDMPFFLRKVRGYKST